MTNTTTNQSIDTHAQPESEEQIVAKTIEREHHCFGVIGVSITETRFPAGGRRYGVRFGREVGDLCLEGAFSTSLGQDELMDLITAASAAYQEIEGLRSARKFSKCQCEETFQSLEVSAGWEDDDSEGFFPSQVEP